MKIRVKKEHPCTKDKFPLGFETVLTNNYSTEDKLIKGFWTGFERTKVIDGVLKKVWDRVWVNDVVIPKGTYTDSVIIDINGEICASDYFYRSTGRSFSEFFDKIE